MLIGHQAREDHDAAGLDSVVVIALSIAGPPQFGHLDTTARLTEVPGYLFEENHAMSDALQLDVLSPGRPIIQEQNGATAIRKEVLQREDLAAVAQGIAGKQSNL